MKKAILAFAVLVLSMDLLARQNDENLLAQNSDSLKAFYPLHVGDYWEYRMSTLGGKVWKTVTGDTVLGNGQSYFIIAIDDDYDHSFRDTLYERVTEDFEVMRYFSNDKGSGEQLLYRLDAETGDSWLSSDSMFTYEVRLDSTYSKEFLGDERVHKSFQTRPYHYNILVHGIGLAVDRDEFSSESLYIQGAIIDGSQFGTVSSTGRADPGNRLYDFELSENFPNPFNATTSISFTLSNVLPERTTLAVYNLLGQKITTLLADALSSGHYSVSWDGTDSNGHTVPSGVYAIKLTVGNRVSVKKMLLLK